MLKKLERTNKNREKNEMQALNLAIKYNKGSFVKTLFDCGVSTNEQSTLGQALKLGRTELIEFLLIQGLDPNKMTPLKKIAKTPYLDNYLDALEHILKNNRSIDVNQSFLPMQYTALHDAFIGVSHLNWDKDRDRINKCIEAINSLIERGAKPLKDWNECTPLMRIVLHGLNSNFTNFMIDKYSNFEAKYYEATPNDYRTQLLELVPHRFKENMFNLNLNSFQIKSKKMVEYFWKNLNMNTPEGISNYSNGM
jgi:ankyrin repeat protein